MKIISSNTAIIAFLLLSGCRSESEVWVAKTGGTDCAIEVQIAVRSEPYRQGDNMNDGDFRVVSSNVLPIHSVGGPSSVVCNQDGVIVEIQWDDVRLLQTRVDQHHNPETQISFDNLRFVIKNQLVRPDGIKHRIDSGPDSQTLSTEFDLMFSPITFSATGDEYERALVIRARLLPHDEPANPLVISQMPDVALDNDG